METIVLIIVLVELF